MFKKAQEFFLKYKFDKDYIWSVNEYEEIQNVWSWRPNDVCQWTIIRSPDFHHDNQEAIWILFENWGDERSSRTITSTWFCQDSSELYQAFQDIKAKFF